MRNNPIKKERKMKNYIVLLFAVFATSVFAQNPTAPNNYLENYSGDFTDTDGDGMTDVAELRYGFNPNDSMSFPNESRVVTSSFVVRDTDPLGSDSDKIYFRFTKFSKSNETRTTNFLTKLIPIMYDVVGNPAETFVCNFYNQGGSQSSWMCVNSGRKMLCDNTWNPRLLVHELIHVWKGKYDFTSKNSNWAYDPALSGFEESAEGMAYEILHDYVEAYPTDEVSLKTLKGGSWDNWAVKSSHFDVSKHQQFLGGGDFWVDNISHYDRYNASAVLIQIFQKHDENFFKKMLVKFYEMVESDSEYRPSRSSIIDLWSSIVPTLNGIPTKQYLEALPILNGEKLANEFYAIAVNNGKLSWGGSQEIYCAFADSQKGDFWWSSPVRKGNVTSKYGIPEWFGKFLGDDGYYYTDNRNQPFVVDVKNVYGEPVTTINGTLSASSNSDGSPRTFATATPSELKGNNFEIGLYTQTLKFPNYEPHTEKYQEDFYFFGYKGFSQEKNSDYSIFVGVDTPFETDVSITIDGATQTSTSTNGCAVFRLIDFPMNYDGVFTLSINNGVTTNVYKRTLLNGGTRDNYRHQTFLIIDKDFDGVEDLYDTNEEVVVVDNTEPTESNETEIEVVVDHNSSTEFTSIVLNSENNSTTETEEVVSVVDDNATDTNTTIVVVTTPEVEVIETSQVFVFDLNISLVEGGLDISWNEKPNTRFYLELKNGETQLIYGGHSAGKVFLDFAEHNIIGTEMLSGRFLEYQDDQFVNYINEFVLDMKSYFEVEPITVQVETNNSIVIVDGVIDIEVTDDNTTIINTDDNVVLIENTESITEYTEENSSITQDDNVVVIVDDNVTLHTNEDETYETNASDSVIVIKDDEIIIEEDTSKDDNQTIQFGGQAPTAPTAIKSIWDTAISTGSNWYYIEWFGYFFKVADNSWIYHETFGWLYADFTVSSESVWFYHDQLGWLWTSSSFFPYVYNPSSQTWFYLVDGGYYDFGKQTWVQNS